MDFYKFTHWIPRIRIQFTGYTNGTRTFVREWEYIMACVRFYTFQNRIIIFPSIIQLMHSNAKRLRLSNETCVCVRARACQIIFKHITIPKFIEYISNIIMFATYDMLLMDKSKPNYTSTQLIWKWKWISDKSSCAEAANVIICVCFCVPCASNSNDD